MVRKLIKIHNEVNVTETTKMREGLRELILVAKGSQEAGSHLWIALQFTYILG